MTEAALEGDLRQFYPPEILQLLQLAQATGRLVLTRAAEQVELTINRGRPVFARTTGVAVRVGEVLVHRGLIRSEAVDLFLAGQEDRPGRRIGAMLVESGAVTREQLEAAVREVLRRIVYGVLLWREGRFRFEPTAKTADEDIQLDLDLDRLILEGMRLADQARAGR